MYAWLLIVLRVVTKFIVGFGLLYAIVYLLLLAIFALFRFLSKSYLSKRIVNKVWPSTGDCKDLHVVVTGGSSGIGLETARLYLQQGAKVSIIARNPKKLQEAKEDLAKTIKDRSIASCLRVVSCDVSSSEEDVKNAFAPSIEAFGTVDILINCAGTSIAGEFDKLDSKEFERMLHINVLGSIYPTRVVVPDMKNKGRGRIVFVSSQVAQVTAMQSHLYSSI